MSSVALRRRIHAQWLAGSADVLLKLAETIQVDAHHTLMLIRLPTVQVLVKVALQVRALAYLSRPVRLVVVPCCLLVAEL